MYNYFRLTQNDALAKSDQDYAYLAEDFDTDDLIELNAKLWKCEEIDEHRYKIRFTVKNERKLTDYLINSPRFPICSPIMTDLLYEFAVRFKALPIELINSTTNRLISVNYNIINLLEKQDVLNTKSSRLKLKADDPFDKPKFVLNKKFLTSEIPMARDSYSKWDIFIHENLANAIKDKGLTGCYFEPTVNP